MPLITKKRSLSSSSTILKLVCLRDNFLEDATLSVKWFTIILYSEMHFSIGLLSIRKKFMSLADTLSSTMYSFCSVLVDFLLMYVLISNEFTGKKFWNLFHLQPMRDQKVCPIRHETFLICTTCW